MNVGLCAFHHREGQELHFSEIKFTQIYASVALPMALYNYVYDYDYDKRQNPRFLTSLSQYL